MFSACSSLTLACRAAALASAEAREASKEAALLDALQSMYHTWVSIRSLDPSKHGHYL